MSIIGIIAEDKCDVDVIAELVSKIVPGKRFSTKHFLGHGCGKIKGKCFIWAQVLKNRGCSTLILLQDLDEHEYSVLHRKLSAELRNCALPKNIVIIPIREIEAWLLSDNQAIRRAMKLINNIAEISNPEEIIDPKRKLNEIVYLKSGRTKRYLNTAHNKKIAAELELENVRKCSSFIPLERFILDNLQ